MELAEVGSFAFGLVIGWITYRTLRRKEGTTAIPDITGVIGAVGGAAVTGLFQDEASFGLYCIGLAVGFFLYFLIGLFLEGKGSVVGWMGTDLVDGKPSSRS